MSKVDDLMGLGTAPLLADVIGNDGVASSVGRTVATGLTATGTNLATSLVLTSVINVVSTAAASTGVVLPAGIPVGGIVVVQNNGANALNIFPHSASGTINGGSAGAAVTTAAAAGALIFRLSTTDWLVLVTAKEA